MSDYSHLSSSSASALVIIDAQNDYCTTDGIIAALGHDVSNRGDVGATLAQAIEQLRPHLKATFFIRTETPSWGRSDALRRQYGRNELRRTVDPAASEWFMVEPQQSDHVITKSRYSAFSDTPLNAALRALGVDQIILTGFTTDVCVDTTARDGFLLDYNVVCLSDCMAGSTVQRHENSLGVIDMFFGTVMTSNELIEHITSEGGAN